MKKVILRIVGALLVLAVAAGVIFRVNFVYIDGEIHNRNETDLYFIYMPVTRISELNRCKNVEYLHVININNKQIEKMRVFEELKYLRLRNQLLDINAPEIEKINQFPKLIWLDLLCYNADLSSLKNDSITHIELEGGKFTFDDKGFLSGCPDLESLRIQNSTINDFITSIWDNEYNKASYTLEDSSFLSDLDKVKTLVLDTMIVEDISGILEMDSLEELSLIQCTIPEEFKKALEDKGINVHELGITQDD